MEFRSFLENQPLTESKQNIINLGFPEIIAKLLYEKFGKNAPLLAKWYRDNTNYENNPKNWWLQHTSSMNIPSLYDLVRLYESTSDPESYKKTLKNLELSSDEDWVYDEDYMISQRESLKRQIKNKFFSEFFFRYNIVQDIINKNLLNLAPYRKLKFMDAQHKYDEKNIFKDRLPLKKYRNGFKWIDVGKRCNLVGHLMKNCGSTGLMSMDKDATMISLFNTENKPHVVVTYSPNEGRISADVGIASSEVKPKYHRYVLDLAQLLNARFDTRSTKSKLLKLKYMLGEKASKIERLKFSSPPYNEYFKIIIRGKEYYSDSNTVISKENLDRFDNAVNQGEIQLRNKENNVVKNIFSYLNQPIAKEIGIEYIPVDQLEL